MKEHIGKTLSFLFCCFHGYSFVIACEVEEQTNSLELSEQHWVNWLYLIIANVPGVKQCFILVAGGLL